MCLEESDDDERARASCPGQEVGFDFRVQDVVEANWRLDDWSFIRSFPNGEKKERKKGKIGRDRMKMRREGCDIRSTFFALEL